MINAKSLVNNRNISLLLYRRVSGEVYELIGKNSVITEIMIDEQINTSVVEMQINMKYTSRLNEIIDIGDAIVLFKNRIDLDYNSIYERDQVFFVMEMNDSADSYQRTLICRNNGYYLEKNTYSLKLDADETTSGFIGRTAVEKDIKVSRLDTTSIVHDARVFLSTTLYDAWSQLMRMSMLKEGIRYDIRFTYEGLEFRRIEQEPTKMWIYEVGEHTNIMEARRRKTILEPDFANIAVGVKYSSSNLFGIQTDEEEIIRRNEESIARYGEFPITIDVTNYGGDDDLEEKLQIVADEGFPTDEVMFKTYSVGGIKPAQRIILFYPYFNLAGIYYVYSIKTIYRDKEQWDYITARKRRDIRSELISQLQTSTVSQEGLFGL